MEFQYSDKSYYGSSKTGLGCSCQKRRTCKIIDFTVPGDSKIEEEKEMIEKYQDLRRQLQKI